MAPLARRSLLKGLGCLSAAAWLRPPLAWALGGEQPVAGQPAPAFQLSGVQPGADGTAEPAELDLESFRGRWLVLYFYPRDFTSGCTLEARGFQRDLAAFHQRGAEVVGISADDGESHASFCGSEGLAFPLLSDASGAVSRSYGSWMAPYSLRHTFLIDPEGIVQARWTGVNPSRHSQEVLAQLDTLQATPA
jgi:peroxiredoxin Q/BCP